MVKHTAKFMIVFLAAVLIVGGIPNVGYGVNRAAAQQQCSANQTMDLNMDQNPRLFWDGFEMDYPFCIRLTTEDWRIFQVYVEMNPSAKLNIYMADGLDEDLLYAGTIDADYKPGFVLPFRFEVVIQLRSSTPVYVDNLRVAVKGADWPTALPEDNPNNNGLTTIPAAGGYFIFTLPEKSRRVVGIFKVGCAGEYQLFVEGMKNANDVIIGYQEPGQDTFWYDNTPATWDRYEHQLSARFTIRSSHVGDYPLWRAYAYNARNQTVQAYMWVNSPPGCE